MKIKGTGSTGKTSGPSKKKSADGNDTDVSQFEKLMEARSAEGASAMSGAGATGSIVQVDALLMAQAAEDATQGGSKNRMKNRSLKILDVLEELRMKMLGGKMTVGDLINVADVVASHRENIDDPHLSDLMDEVDLRAQVEIAKMRVALDRKQAI